MHTCWIVDHQRFKSRFYKPSPVAQSNGTTTTQCCNVVLLWQACSQIISQRVRAKHAWRKIKKSKKAAGPDILQPQMRCPLRQYKPTRRKTVVHFVVVLAGPPCSSTPLALSTHPVTSTHHRQRIPGLTQTTTTPTMGEFVFLHIGESIF